MHSKDTYRIIPTYALAGLMLCGWAWLATPESSAQTADHFSNDAYAEVLDRFVNENGMVDYPALQNDPASLQAYTEALADLSADDFARWPEEEQIALWINAYNAFTLQLIIDHYPIKKRLTRAIYPVGIRHIKGNWDGITFNIMGRDLTLNAIEHDILRVDYDYPAIHMSLVCAAMGCPPLRTEPYEGARLDEQHADQTQAFIDHPDKFRIDHGDRIVYLSPIFDWFGEDFVSSYGSEPAFDWGDTTEQAVLTFLAPHLAAHDRIQLDDRTYSVEYLSYDWSLNEQAE